jgi:hypothetical protein
MGALLGVLLGGGAATAGSLRTRTAALELTLLAAGRILFALGRLALTRTTFLLACALSRTVPCALTLALTRGARAPLFVLRTIVAIRHENLLVVGEKSPALSSSRSVPLRRINARRIWHRACRFDVTKEDFMGLVLLIILVLLLLGAVPRWNYSRDWGYMPSGLLGIIVIVVVILLLTGRL